MGKDLIVKGLFLLLPALLVHKRSDAQSPDKVNSDEEVKELVRKTKFANDDSRGKNFELTTGNEVLQYKEPTESTSRFSAMKTKSWQKADLNKDGKMDVVVSGVRKEGKSYGEQITYSLLFFLSGKDSFSVQEILPEFKNFYPTYFDLLRRGDEVCVEVIRLQSNRHSGFDFRRDTLSVYHTSFFETTNEKATSDPDIFRYYSSSNWGGMPQPDFTLSSSGEATYRRRKGLFNDEDINSIANADSNDLRTFFGFLSRMNVQQLNSKYTLAGVFDVGTSHLVIKFKDGTEKRIDDYGHQGTFGLVSIYSWVGFFIRNLKWQPVVE